MSKSIRHWKLVSTVTKRSIMCQRCGCDRGRLQLFKIQFLGLGTCGLACNLISILLVTTMIGRPNPMGGEVVSGSFDMTLQECGVAAPRESKLKRSQGDAMNLGKGAESGLTDPGPPQISTSGSPPRFVSSQDEDTVLLPKQQLGAEPIPVCPLDISMDVPECRVPLDADEAPSQNTGRQPHTTAPRSLNSEGRKRIHWGSFLSQWWLDVSFEQAERLIMEAKTRDQLNGKFFHEWFSDVAQYHYGLWNDGDRFFTSYIGHPLQGAVVQGIFWQNNDRVRFSEQDFHSAAYRKSLVQAFALAAADAVQWKLGPVSEASIGHVGLPAHWWDTPYFCNLSHAYCHPRTGLNDLIMNEVGGTAMTIGFQWVDKHLQRPMENRIRSRAVIDTMRILTNPSQSLANFFRFQAPWYRDNRN